MQPMHVPSRFAKLSVEVAHDDFDVELVAVHGKGFSRDSFAGSLVDSFADSSEDSFFCDETIDSPACAAAHRVVHNQAVRVRRNSAFPIPVDKKRARSLCDASTSSGSRRAVFVPPASRPLR